MNAELTVMEEGRTIPYLLDKELLELYFVVECTQGIDHCLMRVLGIKEDITLLLSIS